MTTSAGGSFDWLVPPDHPSLAGHFPGQPIVPGVVLLAAATESVLAEAEAAALLGTAPRLGAVKFLSMCRPGDRVRFAWRHDAGRIVFEARRLDAHDGEVGALVVSGHYVTASA